MTLCDEELKSYALQLLVIGMVEKIQRRMSTSEYISLLSGIASNISVIVRNEVTSKQVRC